jgi:hypothetical protein
MISHLGEFYNFTYNEYMQMSFTQLKQFFDLMVETQKARKEKQNEKNNRLKMKSKH